MLLSIAEKEYFVVLETLGDSITPHVLVMHLS